MTEPSLTLALWAGGGVAGACFTGIVALLRSHGQMRDSLTRVHVALTGYDGQNGIAGDLRATKKRLHDLADDMQPLVLDVERLKAERDLRRRAG